jgi:hypothetical protein
MISAVDEAALERIVEAVLDALARGEQESPADLMLLLRRYVATGRPELSDAIGGALARALDGLAASEQSDDRAPEWLTVLVAAAAISQDERLQEAVASTAAGIQRGWPGRGPLAFSFRGIEGCLAATGLGGGEALAASAIDELERVVGRSYEPGEGLAGGELLDHSAAASALLTAFAAAGRLPYAMLADELIQFARRRWWNDQLGGFNAEFGANCEMARVLCRMAVLHGDDGYREIAVLAPRADYARDARRTLERLSPASVEQGTNAALYALALDEYLKLQNGDL